MTAGIHEVFRGSNFFSNAGVGKINKNLNIELNYFVTIQHLFIKKVKSPFFSFRTFFWSFLAFC